MKPRNSSSTVGSLWLNSGIASLSAAAVGVTLLLLPIGGGLTRLSFDLPFALRDVRVPTNTVIIYLDEVSHAELDQPLTAPWDRSLHADLVERLTAEGAQAIVFDILFTDPSGDEAGDARLADAIRNSRRTLLAGNYQEVEPTPGMLGSFEELPYEPFLEGVVGWGNANLTVDPDYGIRRYFPAMRHLSGVDFIPWLPSAVAGFAGAPEDSLHDTASRLRFLNYHGPPGTIPSLSYFVALQPDGTPPGFFKDKLVFIGAQKSADFSGKGKDEFRTPYTFWGEGFAPGVEIHATAALNIVGGNWLERFPLALEVAILLVIAGLAGTGLIRANPLTAVLAAIAASALVALVVHYLVWKHHVWFAWLIVLCEVGVALLCSVVYNSLRLYVEKKLLEQSLAVHLSPALVKRVLSDPALRRRGGVKQEVSLLFTDIENFSRISETLHPDDLVNLLNQYFEAALACIHEEDGTVMDLVGDAIFAVWNAPVEQPDHQERACRAAVNLHHRLVEFNVGKHGLALRTRVGLHAGVVCIGNIGSERRFDYAAVGENTNLGSRIEGLNKHFGTHILATRAIQKSVEHMMVTRLVGHVRVKGFAKVVEIYEVFGREPSEPISREWLTAFERGLQQFRARQFDAAADAFRETIRLRRLSASPSSDAPAEDGPSRFYLSVIEDYQKAPPPPEWIGEVSMREK